MMEGRRTRNPDSRISCHSACTVPTPVWTGSGSTGHCAAKASSISAPCRDPPG